MTNNHSTEQSPATVNGSSETVRLAALVEELQAECARLRKALAEVEAERDAFRQDYYARSRRELREVENLDIPTLEAMSAGPVELIEYTPRGAN